MVRIKATAFFLYKSTLPKEKERIPMSRSTI